MGAMGAKESAILMYMKHYYSTLDQLQDGDALERVKAVALQSRVTSHESRVTSHESRVNTCTIGNRSPRKS